MNVAAAQRSIPAYNHAGKTQKNRRAPQNFQGDRAESAGRTQTTGASHRTYMIHGIPGDTDDDGNTVIGAWGDAVAQASTTVYKPADFDPEDPQYLVRIWDSNNELAEERMVSVNEVDPQNCDAFDMYAYSCHLVDSGECSDAMTNFMGMSAHRKSGSEDYSFSDMLKNTNWVAVLSDFMDMQYRLGNLQGYLECKNYYDVISVKATGDSGHKLINEFSEAEWDELIAKTDAQIDAMKESVKAETERKLEEIEKERRFNEAESDKTKAAQSVDAVGKAEFLNGVERMEAIDKDAVRYTKVSRRNSWDDPNTKETEYSGYNAYTFYTREGIFYLKSGCNTRDREYTDTVKWSIKFESEDDYDRVMEWLSRFPEGDDKRFAANEDFWKDLLSGELDEDGFMEYYAASDHGAPRVLVIDEDGTYRIDRDVLTSPYFHYFNEKSFVSLSVEEVTQRLLDRAAALRRGEKYQNPADGRPLQTAVRDLFQGAEQRTYRFAGEEGSYNLQEWLTELLNRARGGLMDELMEKKQK